MQVWPAIDLRHGKCVRLRQGDFARETVFSDDPLEAALRWQAQGATQLHLVDLDGARSGTGLNRDAVRRIVAGTNCACQLGGGLRDERSVCDAFDMGLARVVIGSAATQPAPWLERLSCLFPDRIWIGIDQRLGLVAVQGWTETVDVSALDLIRHWSAFPIAGFICTEISSDGMLTGPDLKGLQKLRDQIDLRLVASGGISTPRDVHELGRLAIDGVIVGRALYEARLQLPEILAAAHSYPAVRNAPASGTGDPDRDPQSNGRHPQPNHPKREASGLSGSP
jgi:phosphoribosylformimino-5-aminoimidazole carboxamide ribotide isomerase